MHDPHANALETSHKSAPIKRIGLLVFPDFSMLALACASDPLRAANRLSSQRLYEWHVLSPSGDQISSSSGFSVQTTALEQAPPLDRLFVVASLNIENVREPHVLSFLRQQAIQGTTLGALSNGAFVLARAGLLAGYKCTVHWESLRQFAEEFPTLQACRELYVKDRNRWTCAGGTAAMDMMLAQIASDNGAPLAANVAEQFLHSRIRGPEEQQRMAVQWRYGIHDARLVAAIAYMEQNLEHLVSIEFIAEHCNVSIRQLERLWLQHFDQTPQRFYLNIRLHEARRLLKESTESIASIALRCGFVSASHFGSAYRKMTGYSPSEERRLSTAPPSRADTSNSH